MADEQNKSNKGPVNGFGVSEIEKIGAQAYTIPKTEQEQRQRATTARTQIEALQDLPQDVILRSKALTRVASTAPNTLMSAEARIRSSVESRLERHNIQAANVIGREYSDVAVESRSRKMYENPNNQTQSMTMMGSSYETLSQRREEINGQIRNLGAQSTEAAGQLFTGRGPRKDLSNQIAGNAEQANTLVKELSSVELALKTKRQIGADPLSKFEKLNSTGQSATDYLSAKSIGEELSKGGVDIKGKGGSTVNIASADINKALAQEAENLKRALNDLATTTETSKDKLDDMRKSAEMSAENFEKLSKASAAGGGGRDNIVGNLNAAAGGFNAVGAGAQQIMINQRMQQMGNISGFAGLANQQYDMYTKARGGDVASQLALSQFSEADNFGAEMKNATNIVQVAQATGATAQTVAGGIRVAEAAGQKANPLAYATGASTQNTAALQQGALDVVQGGTNLAVIGSDFARGTSAQANRLAGIQAQMQARQAINAVGASQAQGLRDMYTGLDVVGQSMGSRASSFIENSASAGNLQRMEDARMSPEQYIKMSQMGAANMGSTFNNDQVFAARNLEARGMGSMQDNMARMSQLASAGANNPKEGMESVLSAAMTKGLDSSKAINMMVENTAAMVSTSAGAAVGIDTTNAASSMLAASVNPNMANKEFAVQQAMTAAELTKQQTTDKGVSFLGMANTAGLRMGLGKQGINISGDQAINLQGVDIATLKSLQGDPGKAAEFFKDKGINSINQGNAGVAIDTILKEKQLQVIRSAATTQGLNAGDVLEKMNTGTLSEVEKQKLATGAVLSGRTGISELTRETQGIAAPNVSGAVGKDLTEGKGPDDLKKQMDALRTSGFQQLTQAASSASEQLGGFTKALKTFNDLQQEFEKGGKGNEAAYSTAAGSMAKEFSAVAVKFDGAGTKMEQAAAKMMDAAGLFSNRNPVKPAFLDNLDKKQGPKN